MDMINTAMTPSMVHRQGDIKTTIKVPTESSQQSAGGETTNVDSLALSQAMAGLGSNLSVGERVTLTIGKDTVAKVEKVGESNWDRMGSAISRLGQATVMEANEAIKSDPAFAFRETVETVKDTLTQAAPEPVKGLAIAGLYPGVRAGVLALDIYKAWSSLKDPNAGMAEKIINVGHCLTDVGGLVAAAAPLVGIAVPGGAVLAAVAYTADIIVFGFHTLGYFGKKVAQIKAKMNEKDEHKPPAQKPGNEVQPPPAATIPEIKETSSGHKA
ncbi:MAG: hypothetical protein LWY06_17510 [Firmicutes bacterium]|nr:hypothetical protein [Bacillota bacterium]